MDLVFDYPLSTIFVVAVLLFITVRFARVGLRAAGKPTCSRCKTVHPRGAKFCRVCGEQLI